MTLVGVWGAGREGRAIAARLTAQGDDVLVVDERADADRPEGLDARAEYRAGSLAPLLAREIVVCSPGVPGVHPFREELRAAGVRLTSVTDLWMQAHAADTIGVTGTKGKSTTTTLIAGLLTAAGLDAQLGGNIGIPLADLRDDAVATAAELSSYQCASLTVSPRVAVVTSLYEDHLPWHGSRDRYLRDKTRIFTEGAEVLVCSAQAMNELKKLGVPLPARVHICDEGDFSRLEGIELPPALRLAQNRGNFVLAILAAEEWLGRSLRAETITRAAHDFSPLPHRLELVAEKDGVRYIDDTLSTIPQSVAAALASIEGDVILLLGGQERGIDYAPLTAALDAHEPRPRIVTMPENGERIAQEYRAEHPECVVSADSLEDAVRTAAAIATPGTTVVLSPGAPSFDRFRDFADKSRVFVHTVEELTGTALPHRQ